MPVKKQQLEPDMEQWTGSKLGKEYIKAVFCHLACLTFTQSSDQFSSVAQSCPTLCDPMNRSTPGLPVHHQLPGFTQIHVHRVSDAIQPSHPLSSPYPPAPNPSQDQNLSNYIMQNARLDDAQTGIKIAGRNINNLRYADDTTLTAESKEELKSLLMKVKEESEKVGLKLPITSWQIDGQTVETVTDFIFFAFENHCRW